MNRKLTWTLAAALVAAAAVPAGLATAKTAKVRQLVVFRDGSAKAKTVSTKAVKVKVGGKRCAVSRGTALAALARSHAGKLKLHDYGSCSSRAKDGAGLFVRKLGGDANKGRNGWVYKAGKKAASAGAADPTGPFGTGKRLRSGQRVTWFYCRMKGSGCQRTLSLRASAESGGLRVKVVGYDDRGKGVVVSGATVSAGGRSATTGADGYARLSLASGRYRVHAEKTGLVRSFTEKATVP